MPARHQSVTTWITQCLLILHHHLTCQHSANTIHFQSLPTWSKTLSSQSNCLWKAFHPINYACQKAPIYSSLLLQVASLQLTDLLLALHDAWRHPESSICTRSEQHVDRMLRPCRNLYQYCGTPAWLESSSGLRCTLWQCSAWPAKLLPCTTKNLCCWCTTSSRAHTMLFAVQADNETYAHLQAIDKYQQKHSSEHDIPNITIPDPSSVWWVGSFSISSNVTCHSVYAVKWQT